MSKENIKSLTLNSISTRQQCKCDCQLNEKSLIALPGCSKDNEAVAVLPHDWTPKHSGSILANYLKQQKENHEKVLEDFSTQVCRVNTDIDVKVRELAEILVAIIQGNQTEIDCIVQKCGTGEEKFTPEQRNDVLMEISKLYNIRIQNIFEFRENALKLERERADGLRTLMRDQFQRLVAVAHRTPKDLLHDFDDRMFELNQQLLSNNRAYSELEAELRAEADENVVKARSTLNQLCLGVRTAYRCQSARRSSARTLSIKRSMSATDKDRKSYEPINKLIRSAKEELEICAAQLLEAYRQAILSIFSGFSGKLQDLHKALITFDYDKMTKQTKNLSNLEEVIENVLRRISSSFHSKISVFQKSQEFFDMSQNEVLSIQKSLTSLGNCLRDTYTILHDAGHLWDDHMLRSALAQKLTMAAVEDLLTNHDNIELANEIAINQVLEQMVTSPDEEKLNAAYVTLIMLLDNTAEMYQNHSIAEIGRLEEFMMLPPSMANTLLAEFQCFLAKHPRVTLDSSKSKFSTINISGSEDNSQLSSLPFMIAQTELQEEALLNWRNGFLETFENNVGDVPDELRNQAQLWVNERSTALHMRSSLKQVAYSVRKERVKTAFDARLAELRQHEARLQSHITAINELVMTLPEEASQYLSLDFPGLYPIKEWLSHIDKDMKQILFNPDIDPEVRKLKMNSYSPRLTKYHELFQESLAGFILDFKSQIDQRIQNARISNVRFMDKIKLFSEGGRYSTVEAFKMSSALLKTVDLVESCASRSNEALNNRRVQLAALAEQEVLPLQKIVTEFMKGKGPGSPKNKAKKKRN